MKSKKMLIPFIGIPMISAVSKVVDHTSSTRTKITVELACLQFLFMILTSAA
jgi:hypothetical protein